MFSIATLLSWFASSLAIRRVSDNTKVVETAATIIKMLTKKVSD
jgi:hypothetical protein